MNEKNESWNGFLGSILPIIIKYSKSFGAWCNEYSKEGINQWHILSFYQSKSNDYEITRKLNGQSNTNLLIKLIFI